MPLGRSINANGAPVLAVDLDGTVEPGPEQRVDDQRRLADRLRIERQHRKFPAARRKRGIAPQIVPFAEQDHRDLAAARRQFRGRHKTIAAIIAAAGHHYDRPLFDERHGGFGHGLARAHHQRETRRAGGDRQPVGALHLGGGQNLHAESSIQPPFPEALFISAAAGFPKGCIPNDRFAYSVGSDIMRRPVRSLPFAR